MKFDAFSNLYDQGAFTPLQSAEGNLGFANLGSLGQWGKVQALPMRGGAEMMQSQGPRVLGIGGQRLATGGMAKLDAELNQLPEYYLPMAEGGIANHFRTR